MCWIWAAWSRVILSNKATLLNWLRCVQPLQGPHSGATQIWVGWYLSIMSQSFLRPFREAKSPSSREKRIALWPSCFTASARGLWVPAYTSSSITWSRAQLCADDWQTCSKVSSAFWKAWLTVLSNKDGFEASSKDLRKALISWWNSGNCLSDGRDFTENASKETFFSGSDCDCPSRHGLDRTSRSLVDSR